MPNRVALREWDTLVEELRRFGAAGSVTVDDDRIHIDFGSAHVDVTRDGAVETGMPLHDFAQEGTVEFVVDHDAGALTVVSDTVRYTFRRPGG